MSPGDPRQEPAQLAPLLPEHPAPGLPSAHEAATSASNAANSNSAISNPTAHPPVPPELKHLDRPHIFPEAANGLLQPPRPGEPPTPLPQPLEHTGVDTDMASAAWQATAGALRPDGRLRPDSELRPESVRRPADRTLAQTQSDGSAAEIPGVSADPTDAAIMLQVREGDDAAFNYLIEKYQRQIVHFMFRMVHNQAVAEELAQEVFLRVYRSRESYRAEAKFSTWLYRIATNLGVNHARDHKHERAAQNIYLDQPDAETGTTPDVADSRATVEQDLLRDERMRAIREHVMALPERQRKAVLMHKYQEMDYKQIGEVLKLSESATKSLLFRAYQTLREKLKDYV